MFRLLMIVIALAACTRTSEKYCAMHPEDLANCPPSDARRQMCAADSECPTTAPHCLLESGGGACVECFDDAHCMAVGKLACDLDSLSCRSCVTHADCPGSNACTPDGTCGDDGTVIYVAQGGNDSGACTVTAPCARIAYALGRVSGTRYHIKLSGELNETVTISGQRVVLLADPDTRLTGGNPTLKIVKGTVSIYDLEIACGNGAGIRAEMGSTTFLRGTYIHGCGANEPAVESRGGFLGITRARIADNAGGGIATDASAVFAITNTVIHRNGNPASKKGGVTLGATTQGMNNRFEHNTVVDNQVKAAPGVAAGVTCTVTNVLPAPANIIAGNAHIGCDFSGSLVEANPAALLFTPDLHLMAGSPAIDRVDSGIAEDIDGQFRPQGSRKDFGADEYKP